MPLMKFESYGAAKKRYKKQAKKANAGALKKMDKDADNIKLHMALEGVRKRVGKSQDAKRKKKKLLDNTKVDRAIEQTRRRVRASAATDPSAKSRIRKRKSILGSYK